MILVWAGVGAAGIVVALLASRRVIHHASAVAFGSKLPPFVIGTTLVAIGTDLPEIANSIVSSITGHGDLNVSDSIGSAATQVTLVLGILGLVAGPIVIGRRRVSVIGGLTVAALLLGVLFVADGYVSRAEGIALIAAWIGASLLAWRLGPRPSEPSLQVPAHKRTRHVALAFGGLAIVAGGSVAAVEALVRIAETMNVPLYIVGFLGAALGTSLPELIVDLTALRSGQRDLAIGDVFGSSLVDATLSLGIGPAIIPIAVDGPLSVSGGLVACAAIATVVLLLGWTRRHTRSTGVALIAVYAAVYATLIALA